MLDEGGFEALVALFDSTITFHAQYQQRHDIAALLDLLVLDRDNPRSLGWVAQTLRGRLAEAVRQRTGRNAGHRACRCRIRSSGSWRRCASATSDGRYTALLDLLRQCMAAAYRLSDDLGALYFTHSLEPRQSVGRLRPCCCTSSTRHATTMRRR